MTPHAEQSVVQIAGEAAWKRGAENPVALDVTDKLALTDSFLLVSGRSERNTKAIGDAIEEDLLAAGVKLLRREGKSDGRWILLDFGALIVHVFHDDEREFYALERLWKDCPVIPLHLPETTVPVDD